MAQKHEEFRPRKPPVVAEDHPDPLIHSKVWHFTPAMVEGAPELPGVYALWREGEIVFYGCASAAAGHGIRSRLEMHMQEGRGTLPTHYSWEICSRPHARHVQLLNRFWWAFRRLPPGNDAMRLPVSVIASR
jgi:hypothetical protein